MKALLHAAAIGFVAVHSALAADAGSLRDQLALAGKAGDAHAQIELIRRILEQSPSDASLKGRLAKLWLAVGDGDMAERLITGWPDVPPALKAHVQAEVLERRDGKRGEAIAILDTHLVGHPEDLETVRQLVRYLEAAGDQKRVIALLTETPGADADAELLVMRAVAKRNALDFDGALRDFAQAEQKDGENASVTANRAAFARLDAARKNIRPASAAIAADSRDAGPLISRAYWYLYAGMPGPALQDAEAALAIAPGSVAALLLSAQAQAALGKLSVRDAREKLEIDLSKAADPDALGRVFLHDTALAENPANASALAGRSAELAGIQQYLRALNDARAALRIAPDNGTAHLQKIVSLVRLDRRDEAAGALREFAAAKPAKDQLAAALSILADANFQASQFDWALDEINEAIALKPTPYYHKQRAAILARLDRGDEAQRDLAKADQMEKGNRR